MKTINLELKDSNYLIKVGENILNQESLELLEGKEILVVYDNKLPKDSLKVLKESLPPNLLDLEFISIYASEENKSLETLSKIHSTLIEKKYSRDAVLIGFGGGIVCDITGFAASTYQRGVDFILIPTTLLAQVDASVGGKTAINHPSGKNMIGSFHQPRLVVIDSLFLATLPLKEISCGMAEVIKHGLIQDIDYFEWLEKNIEDILDLESAAIEHTISRSLEIKANIVSRDEKERGDRALLNFGHTFGHAIELIGGFKEYNHGEAVSLGMIIALNLSKLMGKIKDSDIERCQNLLKKAGITTKPIAKLDAEIVYQSMLGDKKKSGNDMNFIILNQLGSATKVSKIDKSILTRAIDSSF